MVMQAQQHLAHAFHHHDSLAISRPTLHHAPPTTASAFFIRDPACGHPLAAAAQDYQVAGTTRSELTCNGNNNNHLHDGVCFAPPRKHTRTGGDVACAGLTTMEGHRALLPVPAPVPPPQTFAVAEDAQQLQSSRVLCSAGATTSGRSTPAASRGVLSHIHRHGVEVDALVRMQNERLRAGLEEARRRHVRAAVSAVERAAARRLRAAEADLERALARGAELGERLRQVGAEEQAWRGVATSHEAAAAGLRATLEQILLHPPPRAEGQGEAEAADAGSCCFGPGREEVAGGEQAGGRSRACRSCGGAEACVLVLPCRHLCLCGACEGGVEACPVCAAAKNASLHVLLS
ncbi:unnamed protein product [Urochloa humidicola]